MTTNVFDYFTTELGRAPNDETLRELPVDSNCGADCQKAIDAAATIIECFAKAHGVDEVHINKFCTRWEVAQRVEDTADAIAFAPDEGLES